MRLITGPDDAYAWKVLPEKEYLFKKHMSKHSVGAYRELYRGVGISFEAILASETAPPDASDPPMLKPTVSSHSTLFSRFET